MRSAPDPLLRFSPFHTPSLSCELVLKNSAPGTFSLHLRQLSLFDACGGSFWRPEEPLIERMRGQFCFQAMFQFCCAAIFAYAAAGRMRKLETIIPIILAAGPSPNLPFPKALAQFGGKTALQIAIANCQSLAKPIVVLGSDANLIRHHVSKSVRVVVNRQWRNGQLSSLQAALKITPSDATFMIYPVDHPLIQRATIRHLVTAFPP